MLQTQNSELHNTRKNFLISMHTKYRPIREKPILGIDYDRFIYGNRKPRYNQSQISSSNNNNNESDSPQAAIDAPRDSLIKNQTSHSFRPHTNHSSLSKNSSMSQRFDYKNNSQQQKDDPSKIDFDTFKKYQKEFQEFRKQKQFSNMQNQFMISNGYPKTSKQNQVQETPKNVFTRLHNATSTPNHNKVTRSQVFDRLTTETNHKRNSSSIPQQFDVQNTLNLDLNGEQTVKNNTENKQVNGIQNEQNKNQTNINEQIEQMEKADRNFELEKEQQQKELQNQQLQTDPTISENNFSSATLQFDPNSTAYQKMIDKYVGMNPDYFRHLQGDCICGRCTCGKCRCPYKAQPFDLKRGLHTMYQMDFQKQKNFEQLPQITMDFHSQQYNNQDLIKCCSTTKNDFRPHDVKEPIYHKAPVPNKSECQFIGSSSYQNNYVDWKNTQSEKIPMPKEQTVVQAVPFVGKTIYMENFQKKPMKDRDFEEFIKMRNKSKLSPMNPDFRYLNETNYQFFYQGANPTKTEIMKPYQHAAKITPSAPDQYKTNFIREYEDKSSINCPSRFELIEINKRNQQNKHKEFLEKEQLKSQQGTISMNSIFSQKYNRPLKTHS